MGGDRDVRLETIKALGAIGGERVRNELVDARGDVDEKVRHYAAEGLAKLGDASQAAGSDRFVDNGDGTVTDVASGLLWQREDDGTERGYELAEKYARGSLWRDILTGVCRRKRN